MKIAVKNIIWDVYIVQFLLEYCLKVISIIFQDQSSIACIVLQWATNLYADTVAEN